MNGWAAFFAGFLSCYVLIGLPVAVQTRKVNRLAATLARNRSVVVPSERVSWPDE